MPDIALERGLPCNVDVERFVLGTVLQNDERFRCVAELLTAQDFSLEKHRRIFLCMRGLHDRGERIDRVTLANELIAHRQLESCDGIGYLASLDEGLPELVHIDSYIRILLEKARLRKLILIGQRLVDDALLADGRPAHELATATSERLLEIATSDQENKISSVDEIIRSQTRGLDRFLEPGGSGTNGIRTGLRRLDEMTGGLQRGDLIVFAGRPSTGKTALALNITENVARGREALSVAIFSLEMTRDAVITRMLCSIAGIDSCRLRANRLNANEKHRLAQAADSLARARIFIDDSPGTTAIDIEVKSRKLRAERGLDLCIIDYLGLIASHRKTDNRVRELGEITKYLKLMIAKELNIPVLLLSQLNRAPENRAGHRPILSDLRESGDIEQDADVVAFIYRGEMYEPGNEALRGLAELLVLKQRNGPTGSLDLQFHSECARFEDPAELGAKKAN